MELDPKPAGRAAVAAQRHILVVDDDPAAIQLMGRILAGIAHVHFATSGEAALTMVEKSRPDLVLLDADMPGMGGFETCRALKSDPALADVPVIFVTSHSELAREVRGFEAGAADFIAKPVSPPIVQARVRMQLRLKRMADELRRLSTTDVLTGVANRRRFEEMLAREWLRALRIGEPLSLLLVDVDHFKLFNDGLGHPAGDACLRAVAEAMLGATLRPADLVARYGGEEFAVLLPSTDVPGAGHVAHRVLSAVEALAIAHPTSPTASHVTVSIGVGVHQPVGASRADEAETRPTSRYTPHDLTKAADTALHEAKYRGRARMQRCVLQSERGCACAPEKRDSELRADGEAS